MRSIDCYKSVLLRSIRSCAVIKAHDFISWRAITKGAGGDPRLRRWRRARLTFATRIPMGAKRNPMPVFLAAGLPMPRRIELQRPASERQARSHNSRVRCRSFGSLNCGDVRISIVVVFFRGLSVLQRGHHPIIEGLHLHWSGQVECSVPPIGDRLKWDFAEPCRRFCGLRPAPRGSRPIIASGVEQCETAESAVRRSLPLSAPIRYL